MMRLTQRALIGVVSASLLLFHPGVCYGEERTDLKMADPQTRQVLLNAARNAKFVGRIFQDIHITSDRWPDCSSLREFYESSCRIEKAETDQEKALAFIKWLHKIVTLAKKPKANTKGADRALAVLNLYGSTNSDEMAEITCQIWRLAEGKPACKIYLPKYNHTTVHLWYMDNDHVERWHMFDPCSGAYLFVREGSRIANADDLAGDPTLYLVPSVPPAPDVDHFDTRGWIRYPNYYTGPLHESKKTTFPGINLTPYQSYYTGTTDPELDQMKPLNGDSIWEPDDVVYSDGSLGIHAHNGDFVLGSLAQPPSNIKRGMVGNAWLMLTEKAGQAVWEFDGCGMVASGTIVTGFALVGRGGTALLSVSLDNGDTWDALHEFEIDGRLHRAVVPLGKGAKQIMILSLPNLDDKDQSILRYIPFNRSQSAARSVYGHKKVWIACRLSVKKDEDEKEKDEDGDEERGKAPGVVAIGKQLHGGASIGGKPGALLQLQSRRPSIDVEDKRVSSEGKSKDEEREKSPDVVAIGKQLSIGVSIRRNPRALVQLRAGKNVLTVSGKRVSPSGALRITLSWKDERTKARLSHVAVIEKLPFEYTVDTEVTDDSDISETHLVFHGEFATGRGNVVGNVMRRPGPKVVLRSGAPPDEPIGVMMKKEAEYVRDLASSDALTKLRAARMLAGIATTKSYDALVAHLKDTTRYSFDMLSSQDEDLKVFGSVRSWIVQAIARTKHKDALDVLLPMLFEKEGLDSTRKETAEWDRHAIILALGELGNQKAVNPLMEKYALSSDSDKWFILRALVMLQDERSVSLMKKEILKKALHFDSTLEKTRSVTGIAYTAALGLFARSEEASLAPLFKAAESRCPEGFKIYATKLAGQLQAGLYQKQLRKYLKASPEEETRGWAAWALGKMEEGEDARNSLDLQQALQVENSSWVKGMIQDAIKEIGRRGATFIR